MEAIRDDPHLHEFHPVENSRHAGSEALSLSLYASFDNVNFNLESSDCICEPCYRDYNRNKNNGENTISSCMRNEFYNRPVQQTKHCIYCCGSVCECEQIHQWGTYNWHGDNDIHMETISVTMRYCRLCNCNKPCLSYSLSKDF